MFYHGKLDVGIPLFTSPDHIVFIVSTSETGSVTKVLIMLNKRLPRAVSIDLSESAPDPNCSKPTGFASVATVSDSPHNDHMGNDQSNFPSCSGGIDYFEGGKASGNYVVKKTCAKGSINNTNHHENFSNLRSQKKLGSVVICGWFHLIANQYLVIKTADGITT